MMTRISVLWCVGGLTKNVECVLYEGPGGFELAIERGPEREVFLTHNVRTPGEALAASRAVRERLVCKGWRLLHSDGEARLEQTSHAA